MSLVVGKFIQLLIKVIFFAIMAYIGIRIGIIIKKNKVNKVETKTE